MPVVAELSDDPGVSRLVRCFFKFTEWGELKEVLHLRSKLENCFFCVHCPRK